MNRVLRYLLISFGLLLLGYGCDSAEAVPTGEAGKWLYLGPDGGEHPFRYGDLVTVAGPEARVRSVFSSRDTVIPLEGTPWPDSLAQGASFLKLRTVAGGGDLSDLTRQPFQYRIGEREYWASFEPAFTGFPEYARPESKDFVNHLSDWSATTPGLQYSEYTVPVTEPQPVVVLAERNRSQYLDNLIVVLDTLTAGEYRGRVVRDGQVVPITLRKLGLRESSYTPQSFVDYVNQGYSRSFLLIPPSRTREGAGVVDAKRLPRRSLIDAGDLGNISASFLDDGTVLFLSNDHIVLQGGYVLDLDKGLLTVSDDTDASYRVFVDTRQGITFTLPVSVVELEGSRLRGEDNYLRIEVVE
ncbi:hypothetical protein [Lewinella sp. JB7]|uniref:hypothetical protein n=1 Tax=Lewinella sp. JB7 TaxID=2962887 RepID=UPI0020C93E14|nr:hypothetical protein [Lewinella sp. JB7]MCP9235748.1 hypothetical protein [Lewinella sp. JB7]